MAAHSWRMVARKYDAAGNVAEWEYGVTRGDAANPAAPVQIVPPLRYTWVHSDGLIPGRLDPQTISIAFAASSRAALPPARIGELLEISLFGSWWPTSANEIFKVSFRISDIAYELDPAAEHYPARMTLTGADIIADLAANNEPTRAALDHVRGAAGRAAESAVCLGELITANAAAGQYRVMVPAAIPAYDTARFYNGGTTENALELLTAATNSAAVNGEHVAPFPRFNNGPWPPDPAPANHWEPKTWAGNAAAFALSGIIPTVPDTVRPNVILQPHDRGIRGQLEALDILTVIDGYWTTALTPPNLTNTAAACLIPAGTIDVPIAATVSKMGEPSVIDITGGALESTGADSTPYPDRTGSIPVRIADTPARISRPVTTALHVARDDRNARPTNTPRETPAAAKAAAMFATSPRQSEALAFDRFHIHADRFPTNETFAAVFRRISPRPYRDNTNRGHLVAPLIIYDVAPELDMPGDQVRGYATAGELTIDRGGRIVYTVTLDAAPLELADTPGVYGDSSPFVSGIVTYAAAPTAWTPANTASSLTFERLLLTKV